MNPHAHRPQDQSADLWGCIRWGGNPLETQNQTVGDLDGVPRAGGGSRNRGRSEGARGHQQERTHHPGVSPRPGPLLFQRSQGSPLTLVHQLAQLRTENKRPRPKSPTCQRRRNSGVGSFLVVRQCRRAPRRTGRWYPKQTPDGIIGVTPSGLYDAGTRGAKLPVALSNVLSGENLRAIKNISEQEAYSSKSTTLYQRSVGACSTSGFDAGQASQFLREQDAYYERLWIGFSCRNYMFLVSAALKHSWQKRRVDTRDALHRNMSGSNATPPGVGGGGGCLLWRRW